MTEKARNISESVRFVSMDSVIIFAEGLLKKLSPKPVDLSKTLPNEAIKLRISLLLRAAFDDHRGKLGF